ncbi:MAG: hypothetical protein QOF21_1909 [Actinomycetota bacterium]
MDRATTTPLALRAALFGAIGVVGGISMIFRGFGVLAALGVTAFGVAFLGIAYVLYQSADEDSTDMPHDLT